MAASVPLSTLLSQVLVAHTIELDNEFERRLLQSGESARVTSVVMWSNFLRFVGDGIPVGVLADMAGLPKARVLSNLGGMERWRYVFVAPPPAEQPSRERRDGWGSARALRSDWVVRPTPAGCVAREVWPALFGDIEDRWTQRFGTDAVGDLRGSLQAVVTHVDYDLPHYLPMVASSDGLAAGFCPRQRSEGSTPAELATLLAQVLLAFTLDFERRSELSLPLTVNFVRILGTGMLVRDIPETAGVSKEATSIALTALVKAGCVTLEGSTAATREARLTARGEAARRRQPREHQEIEAAWVGRFGENAVGRLSSALESILVHPHLSAGLHPDPGGWRASKPYLARTEALLTDPRTALPHHPLVLHRGGWPDGS